MTGDRGMIDRLLHHNAWATALLADRCRTLSPQQFARRFEIGPGTLQRTLLHIVGAMHRWADRIGDRAVRPSVDDEVNAPTPDEIIAILDETAADLAAVVGCVVDEDRLDEIMELRIRGRDEPFRFTRGTAIIHVLTHGVHHRAQALNILRRLGVEDLPEIDAIDWELHS